VNPSTIGWGSTHGDRGFVEACRRETGCRHIPDTSSTGGDAGFVAELIDQFIAEAPELVAVARAGLEAGDADEVRRDAHTLKSNAATFGAGHLAESSRVLEEAAKRNDLDDGPQQLGRHGTEAGSRP